jgi:hypothetical protein
VVTHQAPTDWEHADSAPSPLSTVRFGGVPLPPLTVPLAR